MSSPQQEVCPAAIACPAQSAFPANIFLIIYISSVYYVRRPVVAQSVKLPSHDPRVVSSLLSGGKGLPYSTSMNYPLIQLASLTLEIEQAGRLIECR